MSAGRRKLVQAQQQFRDAAPVLVFEPASVVSLAPLVVSWRGANVTVPYLSGLVLSAGQPVVLAVPPSGTPFVLGVLTGP